MSGLVLMDGASTPAVPWSLTIRVVGHEPHQQGSMAIRYQGKGASKRAFIAHDDNAALKKWRAEVGKAADSARAALATPWVPIGTAAVVDVVFYVRRPASVTREYPAVRPDLDKFERACLDALTEHRVVTDDSVICDLWARKRYADGRAPGATIRVRPLASQGQLL
jgi:Holliday junction resolvase RusA-like endonuclease